MSGVPYIFANATTSIPLSQLDVNFATPATLGNTTVGLGNTVTTIGNLTLTGVNVSSGNVANSITLGTTTNDNASSGYVGEYVSSIIPSSSAISPSSTVTTNLTSISLSAGDWDVRCNFGFTGSSTSTLIYVRGSSSSVSATQNTSVAAIAQNGFTATGGGAGIVQYTDWFVTPPTFRYSLSTTTTIYAVVQVSWGVSQVQVYGSLSARRVR